MVMENYEQLKENFEQWKKERLRWWERAGMAMSFTDEFLEFLILTMLRIELLQRQQTSYLAQLLGLPLELPPAITVSISTPWVAKEPEQIFDQAIRSTGTFDSAKMVDWTNGKRFIIKVESSLDESAQIQVIGNVTDSFDLATNLNAPLPCSANGNISIGLAWDDWHPYIGVRVTTAAPPTVGLLKIWVVIQE